jgi:CBS domain containing-hemolysin-like protein
VGYMGWSILLICLFAGGTLFFAVNAVALRTFSHVKLQDAFKAANKKESHEDLTLRLAEKAEELVLTCWLFRLILNMCTLLLLVDLITIWRQSNSALNYVIAFLIAMAIFLTFSLAIPHAWAKYAGENVLSRTFKILIFFSIIASPFLYIFRLYDGFIRRLAGIAETTPQEQQEENQEEFLTGL